MRFYSQVNTSENSWQWIRGSHQSRLCSRRCHKRNGQVRRRLEGHSTPCSSHHASRECTSYFRHPHRCNALHHRREECIACDTRYQTTTADTVSFHRQVCICWKTKENWFHLLLVFEQRKIDKVRLTTIVSTSLVSVPLRCPSARMCWSLGLRLRFLVLVWSLALALWKTSKFHSLTSSRFKIPLANCSRRPIQCRTDVLNSSSRCLYWWTLIQDRINRIQDEV